MTPRPLDELRVLVVEDDMLNATLMLAMLKILGITRTRICTSGAEIPKALTEMDQFDVILLDLQLPGESGFEIIGKLRKIAKYESVPIVAVSAQVMPDVVDRAEQVGFDGFLGKPLNFDRFPTQLQRIIQGKRVWEPR